ncbi:DUF5701 family protein [Cellulomonas sp. C5510]|uniref:DUF5701 family protein n=1 Tax=Cellulomonas sp. C5510 TaxID=2871170 RepID=UPI001C96E631|nr:DUF5701 family protein [Cellulomonas sp. C5510]QZN87642.1 DUF5701 family protein [Cellulomonas sp. C5510]
MTPSTAPAPPACGNSPTPADAHPCFSLLESRARNQRVPAVWISARAPKLGWCWDRTPHTWLGAASAGGRASAG